jgi:transcriptional antiterminator NusG
MLGPPPDAAGESVPPPESAAAPSEPDSRPVEQAPPPPTAAEAPARVDSSSNGEPAAAPAEESDSEEIRLEWYILKVQSNREDSIRNSLIRNVRQRGLERYFGDLDTEVIVPTEMVTEFKGGKKRVSKRKLYPGYLVVRMAINDDTWYLVRETAGIGDFTGSIGRPSPMRPEDVKKIIAKTEERTDEAPKLKINFKKGDRVKINEGTFENFEGDVDTIDEANGRVIVMINIFGRSTPVELEYWQIEAI